MMFEAGTLVVSCMWEVLMETCTQTMSKNLL